MEAERAKLCTSNASSFKALSEKALIINSFSNRRDLNSSSSRAIERKCDSSEMNSTETARNGENDYLLGDFFMYFFEIIRSKCWICWHTILCVIFLLVKKKESPTNGAKKLKSRPQYP
jgi:hypothetical protein